MRGSALVRGLEEGGGESEAVLDGWLAGGGGGSGGRGASLESVLAGGEGAALEDVFGGSGMIA